MQKKIYIPKNSAKVQKTHIPKNAAKVPRPKGCLLPLPLTLSSPAPLSVSREAQTHFSSSFSSLLPPIGIIKDLTFRPRSGYKKRIPTHTGPRLVLKLPGVLTLSPTFLLLVMDQRTRPCLH